MDSLANALLGGILLLRDMLCTALPTTACAAHGGGTTGVWGGLKLSGRRWAAGKSGAAVWPRLFRRSVAVISPKVFGCQHLRLPACYSGISGFLRQTEIFHGALRWLLNLRFTTGRHYTSAFTFGGAFHNKRYRNAGNLLPYHGSFVTVPLIGGNDSAFNRAVFSAKVGSMVLPDRRALAALFYLLNAPHPLTAWRLNVWRTRRRSVYAGYC